MRRYSTILAQLGIVAVVTSATVAPAFADRTTAIARVAAEFGYDYSYLGPEDAVSLSKPGVTIVVRPGERLFDVNDRTEAMDGAPPRFSHDDVYVSDAMVRRLRAIAERYARVAAPSSIADGSTSPVGRDATRRPGGAITDLALSQVPGQQAVYVRGKGPAGVPVTLTVISTMSAELPDAVLSRQAVETTSSGAFVADVTIAPGYFRGSILTVVASSFPGTAPATARITLKAPNQDLPIPADAIPRSIR